ncbi:hypothetical protein B0F88_1411 [Methylobacter tundripaludum]|uniref:DUF2239 family protein n=1 Tax=Methylobacter tundripaludum TaxID=173365 RepID=A0A2S6GDX7_9GAMM|nr:DUF2239 family protein [Methylobacter tundripaludum]PPK63286.1 hypothetical protein B0F88_1411 [Methylobacter tundripaludum]
MNITEHTLWIAFSQGKRIASGAPRVVATDVKHFVDSHATDNVLVFDAKTSFPVEIDLRGSLSAVLKHLPIIQSQEPAPDTAIPTSSGRTAGRPKLGVTAREVTLLPRHWEWLATQPGGASVALRKLVEQALRSNKEVDRLRQAQEAAYRFMNVMAGDSIGFEEATRALFDCDFGRLQEFAEEWPDDVRNHALSLAEAATVKGEELECAL